MGKIKAISFLCISVFCVSLFTACNSGKNTLDVTDKEEEKKYMTLLRLKTSAMLISRGMPDPLS